MWTKLRCHVQTIRLCCRLLVLCVACVLGNCGERCRVCFHGDKEVLARSRLMDGSASEVGLQGQCVYSLFVLCFLVCVYLSLSLSLVCVCVCVCVLCVLVCSRHFQAVSSSRIPQRNLRFMAARLSLICLAKQIKCFRLPAQAANHPVTMEWIALEWI